MRAPKTTHKVTGIITGATEDKIRMLGTLATAQINALPSLDPENEAQIRQFEDNSRLATDLIQELSVSLKMDYTDFYDFFCRITAFAAENGSDAGGELALCLPELAALQNRE